MKFKKNVMKALFLVALLSFIAVYSIGCNRVIKDEKGVLVFESKPVSGGLLRLACVEAKTLNPLMLDSKSYKDIVPLLFTGLYELETNGKAKASLADDTTSRINGNSITLKLKDGIKWSDGSDIGADDVKYSFDLLKSQPASMYYSLIKNITSCDARGDRVVFQFTNNTPMMKESLTFPVVKRGTKNEKKNIVTNGRYKVSKYVTLDRMLFTANGNWSMGSPAYIPEIEVIFINDIGVFVTAFQSQEVDVVNITDYDWSKYEEIRGTVAKSYFTGEMEALFFNTDQPKLMDKRLRQAVAYGIDRQKLMDKYVIGNGVVTDVPIAPNSWLNDGEANKYVLSYSDGKNLLEDIAKNPLKIVTPTPSITPTPTITPSPTPKPTPTPGKKKNVKKTGEPIKQNVEKKEPKVKLTLLVNSNNEKRIAIANDIKDSLKEENIEVTIEKVSFAEYISRIKSKNYDMYVGAVIIPETQDFSIYLDSSLPFYIKPMKKDGANYWAKLLATGSGSGDELKTTAKGFQDAFRDELPYLPLYHKKGALILAGSIKGSSEVCRYNVFRTMGNWYFEKSEK